MNSVDKRNKTIIIIITYYYTTSSLLNPLRHLLRRRTNKLEEIDDIKKVRVLSQKIHIILLIRYNYIMLTFYSCKYISCAILISILSLRQNKKKKKKRRDSQLSLQGV